MPSSRNSGPVTSKPKVAYQATSGPWRVEDDVLVRADLEGGLHQPVAPALAAHGRVQGDPADPPGVCPSSTTRAQPSTTPCSSSSTTCRVSGSRSRPSRSLEEAVLLDDEHVLAELPQAVGGQRARGRANGGAEMITARNSTRRPPGLLGLGDERQDRVDVQQAGLLDVGERPSRRRPPGAASSRQPGLRVSRVPQNISARGSPARSARAGETSGPAEVLGGAGPPLGVRVHLPDEQPRVLG